MNAFWHRLWGPRTRTLPNGKTISKKRSLTWLYLILVVLAFYYSIELTGFKMSTLLKRGNQFFVILGRMYPPNWDYWASVQGPLLDTIKMSIIGSVIGALLAIPAAVIASYNMVVNRWVTGSMKLVLSLIRTVPTLIYASVLTLIFGIGTFAGTVAIAIFTFSFMAKQLYEMIETVDMKPFEAMEALGANRVYSFMGAILPQVLPSYLASSLYTFEGNVRHAAILGWVGAGGIGVILNEKIAWREYTNLGMILVALYVTVLIIEYTSRYLRSKLT